MVVRIAVKVRGRARPIRVGVTTAALALLVATIPPGGAPRAWALDAHATSAAAPLPMFKNSLQALEKYREDSRSGDSASSLIALRYAADGGQPLAQWKLGSMYQSGQGVPQSDLKAYHYFSRIVAHYDQDQSDWRETSVVSSAFVAIGVYSLNGIPGAKVRPDPARALEMFHYAATNFGDPNAQYNLARMYLDGVGVKRDPRQAARWLNLAADKGHKDAQALLGNLLFKGDGPVQPQRALGLMYLTLAREAAVDPKKDAWIIDLHDAALQAATDDEKGMARHFLEQYVSRVAGGLTAER
ncbi:MAG TPA: tetratricopeptide repeat protein [Beijerinckiaceae bacterium]|nr:tetratricopeptide repeat protein [Beijerinckiaceae bacterium]